MAKQLLFLSNHSLNVWPWDRGGLGLPMSFHHDEAGWQAFSQHLKRTKNIPNFLLVDLIEEEFQLDTMPHVSGPAHRAIVARRLTALYRDTPYRQASRQGRDPDGRRDDRMLFSALTNAEMISPWLDVIAAHMAPLVGIYSVALMGQMFAKKFDFGQEPLLLVTEQSSGLRQSFYLGGYLQFSRLIPNDGLDTLAGAILTETAKTLQFLGSNRLLARDSHLQVLILCDEQQLPQLRTACQDKPALTYRLLGMDKARQLLNLKVAGAAAECDELFLSLLGSKPPPSHYHARQQSRHYQLWKARSALHGLSAVAAAASLLWSGANSLDAWEQYQNTLSATREASVSEAHYKQLASQMSPTKVNPHNMKSAVDLAKMLQRNAPAPGPLLFLVSAALGPSPELKVNSMQWEASDIGAPATQTGIEAPPSAAPLGIPRKPVQQILLDGEIEPFHGDYRDALGALGRFKATLEKNPGLKVDLLESPLDIKPSGSLVGKIDPSMEPVKAAFRLKIVWNP